MGYIVKNITTPWLKTCGIAAMVGLGLMLAPLTAQAQDNATEYECIPAIRIVADLGYCFGFTVSYFEAIGNQAVLSAIESRQIEGNISSAHRQCYATDFVSQKHLGTMAFSSYVNLADDTLLRRTSADCNLLLDYYARQSQSAAASQ